MNKKIEDILDYAEKMDLTALEISVLSLKLQTLHEEVKPQMTLEEATKELRVNMDQFIYKNGTLFAPEKEYYQIMQNLENLLYKIYGENYDN